MVYVDQPIGTGFSPAAKGAPAKIQNEQQVAEQFMGFWKNFVDTFDLTGRKVYLTGESYAGQYIPYIAYYMLKANDSTYFNVNGIQINGTQTKQAWMAGHPPSSSAAIADTTHVLIAS